jgi:hypothetical protein
VLLHDPVSQGVSNLLQRAMTSRHAFTSMACTGWHATILEFARSPAATAQVFLLEFPRHYTQGVLDRAGIGQQGEGLLAQEGVGMVRLRKKRRETLEPGDVVITECVILAQARGLQGTTDLLAKLATHLVRRQRSSALIMDCVSFSIASTWSAYLAAGFAQLVWPQLPDGTRLLPGIEPDRRHWLTLKPVREYLVYGEGLTQRGLTILTLGAGGRLGMICLTIAAALDGGAVALDTPLVRCKVDPASFFDPPGRPLYLSHESRSVDNLYFVTDITAPGSPQAEAAALLWPPAMASDTVGPLEGVNVHG